MGKNEKTKAEQICDYLLGEINNGNLKPGDYLPSERDLAAQLGVSRMPLREALRALCNKGVLITRRGDGTIIAPIDTEQSITLTLPKVDIDDVAVVEMMQMRIALESEAARLAAIEASDQEIEIIRLYKDLREAEIQKQLAGEVSEKDEAHVADTRFHRAIVEASHNSVFIQFLDSIVSTIAIHQRKASAVPDMFEKTTQWHTKIYEAIASRNPEMAAQMMRQHLESVASVVEIAHTKEKP